MKDVELRRDNLVEDFSGKKEKLLLSLRLQLSICVNEGGRHQ